MCFWMATGSGKSIIIIKLIEVLKILIDRGEIPNYDILFLTYRDDLINQFKKLVKEFNDSNNYTHIILKELKEYPELKNQRLLLNGNNIIVYFYRSDNLSDIQHEKIIDFRNYFQNGQCYVLLDEAHKGDREESKRQHIYSFISRNGFLFNFSATFIDERDIITCVYEFNLASFTNDGFGKHLKVLNQEILAFKERDDYNQDEKIKIILKSLLILTYVKKNYLKIIQINKELYHKPLYLVLGKTVNIDKADLKLFFKIIQNIANQEVKPELFDISINELINEFIEDSSFMFEKDKGFKINEFELRKITQKDILKLIYNSNSYGEIEIIRRLSNIKELAFKLKTSNKPFALLKIGNILKWIKTELKGYIVQEKFEDDTFFENLNKEGSDINILLGAQSFYEGWDSNRPNVINYINIGKRKEAKKFVLQSIGRGVRIEPIKNKRKRLKHLFNSGEIPNKQISIDTYNQIKDLVLPLETLFIYSTNKEVVNTILQQLEKLKKNSMEGTILNFFEKNPLTKNFKLLYPYYIFSKEHTITDRKLPKYQISQRELIEIRAYLNFLQDDRIVLLNFDANPEKVKKLRAFIKIDNNSKIIKKESQNIDLQIQNLLAFFDIINIEHIEIKALTNQIKHHEKINVNLENVKVLEDKIKIIKEQPIIEAKKDELFKKGNRVEYDHISKELDDSEEFETDNQKIRILYNEHHYYNPLILAKSKNVDFIKHIIKIESEVKFIEDLKIYLSDDANLFKQYDWWFFSKIDESIDEIYIPYYDNNKLKHFFPDFIFWLKKEKNYIILFIDPKGSEHLDWADKIKGFKEFFEYDNKAKDFNYNGYNIQIKLLLRSDDATKVKYRIPEYSKYWFDEINTIFECLRN